VPRPRDPSIDRAIIDACVELLGEEGRSRLSRDRIARRAGVSLPAVNRRFGSVDEIIRAIASTPMHEPGSLPPATDLRSHLVARLTRAARTQARLPIRRSAAELIAAAAGDEQIDEAFAGSLARVRAETLELIDRARETGELPPDADGELLLDLLDGALYYRLLWRNTRLAEADVETLVDTVLAGVRGVNRR
jgi:AcrR family transcriptional regulator